MKKVLLVVSILSTGMMLLFHSCKKKCTDCWINVQPSSDNLFIIKKDGIPLNDSILLKSEFYYFNSTGEKIIRPHDIDKSVIGNSVQFDDTTFIQSASNLYNNSEFNNSHIFVLSGLINMVSSKLNVYNFYFKYPDGDIDTLYIKAEEVSKEQGTKELCNCTTPIRELKFNGKDVIEDTSIHLSNGQPVYLFEK